MEGSCSTGQIPQCAVVPVEEEEEYVYCVYYIPLHVSSSKILIIRRLNCIGTASGIVTHCRWPFGAQVATGRSKTLCFFVCHYARLQSRTVERVLIKFDVRELKY
jgi:hypothetical protein